MTTQTELKPTAAEYTWAHNEAIAMTGVDPKSLPKPIKQRMTTFSMWAAKYNKKPDEKLLQRMVEFSAKIADEITNYSEKDLPDAESADAKPAAPEQNQPSAPVNIAGLKDSESNSDVKDAIMAHISKEGRIYYTDLRKIMNQRDLDDRIQVGGLSLTRSLAFYYPD